jgi:hypothetical protein
LIQIPEYDLNIPSSLTVLRESEVISATDAQRFRDELINIAGMSPQGKPRLRLVWGPTHIDEMSTHPEAIKYLDFVYNNEQLGERRWFIEIHRTPEFLARSGRYQIETRQDTDGEKLLKSLPSEGCYDYWLRLERKNLTYHAPDGEALEAIRAMWAWELSPQSQKDLLLAADREMERRQAINMMRQQRPTRLHFSSVPLINPA